MAAAALTDLESKGTESSNITGYMLLTMYLAESSGSWILEVNSSIFSMAFETFDLLESGILNFEVDFDGLYFS